MTTTETRTAWRIAGKGYEFCNCQPGCTCNFNGFPTSPDGSCKAAVINQIASGHCGDVDLAGVTTLAILDWPKAIHDGGGKAVMVAPPAVTDEQLGALAQIYTGQLGGMPWEILGTTFEVAGVVRADIDVDEDGMHSGFRVEGVGEARGTTLKNPVTGEDHLVSIVLNQGFIWKQGDCGQGTFEVEAEGIHMSFKDSNWILYDFDWTNQN
ncbi:DUF1326 domain-containing protein [Paraconexibacter antarcticus]|uniref:DUF1326 domain-containing protein n=1 Tax=Paraconexibacter antarcticus TaxID=2949664 RepID=A0ABY5DNS1_9ACTN|nr:DUF1326 domain-containing protein [Paraconexibacter antarcticus]UTI63311.1 DUF1326 domain-containing protein [Paraconexibacter antarcticus]